MLKKLCIFMATHVQRFNVVGKHADLVKTVSSV